MSKSMALFPKNFAMLFATTRHNLTCDCDQSGVDMALLAVRVFETLTKTWHFRPMKKAIKNRISRFNLKPTLHYHYYLPKVGNYTLLFLYTDAT
jgi:ribosome-associated toxin RatA of RatAB toxin-antitoxin module